MRRVALSLSLKLPTWCVLAFGLIASFTLFFGVYRQEQHNEHANFERRAQFRAAALQQGMTNSIEALQVVHQLFVTHGNISRAQFHSFTQPLRARHPNIEAFGFQRQVSKDERPAYEARMRTQYPDFAIEELVHGKRVVAAVKDRYDVIEYVESTTGNESAIGFDTSSQPFQSVALLRAADTGLPSATGLFRLIKDIDGQRSFRILMAVYKDGAAPNDVASRLQSVLGYTLMTVRVSDLFSKILASADSFGKTGMTIRVYAAASPDENKLAYSQGASGNQPAWRPAGWFGGQPKYISRTFEVAGTTWQIAISEQPMPLIATYSGALFVLLMGLLSTFAATAYLRAIGLRTQRIQQLVAQRTDELKQINGMLIDDINARKQLEHALVDSEERSRELAELSSDWFWEQDEQFRYTAYSTGMMENGAPLASLMLGATRWGGPVDQHASDWPAHRAMLEAHQPFKNFEYKTLIDDKPMWVSASGKPQFDTDGHFKGYRGTSRSINQRKLAEEALSDSRAELHKLADHLERAKEGERKRIARDIHDELGQNLLALRIDVSMMATPPNSVAITKQRIDAALNQIDTTIKSVRAIMNDLRPAVLDLGLHAAVEWQVKEFQRSSGISCALQIDHEEFVIDDKRATALFRIVQESLTNIMRHARASHVQIDMQRSDGVLLLRIADDGIGLFPDCRRKANAFGLVGIAERIHAMKGTFSTASSPGNGMTIMVSIPI